MAEEFHAYFCPHCKYWHAGHKPSRMAIRFGRQSFLKGCKGKQRHHSQGKAEAHARALTRRAQTTSSVEWNTVPVST
jgi:hypothetical protein